MFLAISRKRVNILDHLNWKSINCCFDKIKALVQAFRLTMTRIDVVRKERQLLASCFIISTLIKKLPLTMQSSWCHYLAERSGQVPHKAFKAWLGMEGRASIVERKSTLAAQYQQGNVHPPPRAQGLHGIVATKRSAIRI